jgi:hypothetical protein
MADALGTHTREVNFDGYRWLSADRHVAPRIYVHGPHHVIDPEPLDESAVTAALSKAEAALDTNAERHALAHANGEI